MQSIISFFRSHLSSVSSWAAVALTVLGTLLASGAIGPGTTLYHVLGGLVSALTALGVKSLSPSTATPAAVAGPPPVKS